MTVRRSLQTSSKAWVVLAGFAISTAAAAAEPFLVKDGQPLADIVIATQAPRSVRLAARELQRFVEKLSGARLEVVHQPTPNTPVQVFVGRSPYTDRLAITDEGLLHGAFRIVSGTNWLALLGRDSDFTPVEPWARSHNNWLNEKLAEWDRLTGALWANPLASSMYRHYSNELDLWEFDEGGSLNAVHAFLHDLGVRWYMPGELGEIVPRLDSIPLPAIDRTVRPALDRRVMGFARYFSASTNDILWSRHLGINKQAGEEFLHHGIRYVTDRDDQKQAHPEYYALINGKPQTEGDKAQACLSSEALFQENLRFVRTLFDHYDVDVVSVMPADGFTAICQCDACKPQATLDRGASGWYSDYVWAYVVRIANEIAKTHPGKKILCGAYSTYRLPPLRIDRLPANVLVQITNGRPVTELDPAAREELIALRRSWQEKTSNKLSISMNYPFTQRGEFRPQYFPHVIAQGMRDVKDQVWREDIWLPEKRGLYQPGVNHLNAYVMARCWWNPDLDVDALLDEYYRLFYGPAAAGMKTFIEYSEAHYPELTQNKEAINRALDLFETARKQVEPESVYGKRLALVDDFLAELRKRRAQLNVGRGPVPEFRVGDLRNGKWTSAKKTFKIDGVLAEPFWSLNGALKDLRTGAKPAYPTRFHMLWDTDGLYVGIRCQDKPGEPPVVGTQASGDPAIWNGDHLELLIETDAHSYYQLVINPAGAVLDLDRKAPKANWYQWDAKAEVAVSTNAGEWTVEARIPVTESTEDPLHLVVGRRPSPSLPWYFNLLRHRARGQEKEVTAFAPTGTNAFHDVMHFGKLYMRK